MYIELLEKMYPDQNKVQMVKNNFHIEARAINDNFSVMLCDPSAGRKNNGGFELPFRKRCN